MNPDTQNTQPDTTPNSIPNSNNTQQLAPTQPNNPVSTPYVQQSTAVSNGIGSAQPQPSKGSGGASNFIGLISLFGYKFAFFLIFLTILAPIIGIITLKATLLPVNYIKTNAIITGSAGQTCDYSNTATFKDKTGITQSFAYISTQGGGIKGGESCNVKLPIGTTIPIAYNPRNPTIGVKTDAGTGIGVSIVFFIGTVVLLLVTVKDFRYLKTRSNS